MNKTLLAVALALAYSATPAWADGGPGGPGGHSDPGDTTTIDVKVDIDNSDSSTKSGNYNNKGDAAALGLGSTAANNGASATSNFSNAFNTSKAIAKIELGGNVSGNTVNLGNAAANFGSTYGAVGGTGKGGTDRKSVV